MRVWPEIVVIVHMALKCFGTLLRAVGIVKELPPSKPRNVFITTAVITAISVWVLGKGGFWTSLGWTP